VLNPAAPNSLTRNTVSANTSDVILDGTSDSSVSVMTNDGTNSTAAMPASVDNASSWAATAAHDLEQWTQVPVKVHKQPRRPVKVTGKKTGDAAGVKGVPRKPILAAYVGRLHKDTSEEVLTKYLTDEGMRGIVCKKLTAKNGKKINTAAFFVSCCPESSELFYDETRWPEGSELRDWIFRNNGS